MRDGSDAIADWPILNALLNTASGRAGSPSTTVAESDRQVHPLRSPGTRRRHGRRRHPPRKGSPTTSRRRPPRRQATRPPARLPGGWAYRCRCSKGEAYPTRPAPRRARRPQRRGRHRRGRARGGCRARERRRAPRGTGDRAGFRQRAQPRLPAGAARTGRAQGPGPPRRRLVLARADVRSGREPRTCLYQEASERCFREMLSAGYTSVAEFHYVHHRPDGKPYGQPNIARRP